MGTGFWWDEFLDTVVPVEVQKLLMKPSSILLRVLQTSEGGK
jgi:hypothetical protein